ncbi:hypothetical protein [Cylindrospermum sp. FACHB-282]|uniref:hypothetical protein n=1 Tax=Cylindrospermum sp. FACHB-282 TaxID=2692794 RepID=UPI0016872213|nr:hypothetical protein [Cylindrospermum sp. FACHB-282]MBD2387907.1 hypothetical protein [Cylindrospermum sp. FACHB-282]
MTQLLEQAIARVKQLTGLEQDRIATLILQELENPLVQQNLSIIDESDSWTEQDQLELASLSLQYAADLFPESEEITE